jgi:RHS repeat-associated protein
MQERLCSGDEDLLSIIGICGGHALSCLRSGPRQVGGTTIDGFSYDENGNTASKTDGGGTTNYTWDYENRLASVALPGGGGTVNFTYDPFGRRIRKASPAGTAIFVYDGDNVIEELDGSGNLLANYTQGLGNDEPLAMDRSGVTSYYHADGLGSTTSITNSSGALAGAYTFDSFGKLTASTGTITNPFRYTGREFDSETGLYYYRARYYDPTMGRFISEDPIRWRGGDVDFYVYAFNNPVILGDPFGLRCWCGYSISTGHFQCYGPKAGTPGYYIDTYGYSGYGVAQNDLAQTDLPGKDKPRQGGPIPMGTWTFGEGYADPHRGDPSFKLTPTQNVLIPPGRSGITGSFMIHADSSSRPAGGAYIAFVAMCALKGSAPVRSKEAIHRQERVILQEVESVAGPRALSWSRRLAQTPSLWGL